MSTTLQRENELFILNTSANILSSNYRCNPVDGANCEDALGECSSRGVNTIMLTSSRFVRQNALPNYQKHFIVILD